jgi:hypothetical protein
MLFALKCDQCKNDVKASLVRRTPTGNICCYCQSGEALDVPESEQKPEDLSSGFPGDD